MSNVVKFETAKVPAHLSKFAGMFGTSNEELGKSGPSYPVLNIKGKTWSVVEDKVKTKLLTPDGDPLASVRVVLVKAAAGLSKVFYKAGYDEDESAGQKPDCFSHDGVRPDSMSATPQAKVCATCDHNAWGSGNNGKGRACSDSKRVAIVAEGSYDKPMLLRVPPASLKGLAEYGALLGKRGVPYQGVVTKISFDSEASSPKLVFKPVGYLSEENVQTIHELQSDEVVEAILGKPSTEQAPLIEEDEDDVPAAAPAKPATKAKAKPAPAPVEDEDFEEEPAPKPAATKARAKPAPTPVEDEDFEEEPAPKPAAKAKPKPAQVEEEEFEEEPAPKAAATKTKPKPATVVAADDDLESLIDGLDFDGE